MKTKFLTPLVYEDIIGGRFIRLHEPFRFFSEVLDMEIEIPSGFVCDKESVPVLKATSNRGGVAHDYFCRKDSVPVVTKQKAADIYKELQVYRDSLLNEGFFKRIERWFRRNIKTLVVRVAPGYFHKLNVLSSLEEVAKTL